MLGAPFFVLPQRPPPRIRVRYWPEGERDRVRADRLGRRGEGGLAGEVQARHGEDAPDQVTSYEYLEIGRGSISNCPTLQRFCSFNVHAL